MGHAAAGHGEPRPPPSRLQHTGPAPEKTRGGPPRTSGPRSSGNAPRCQRAASRAPDEGLFRADAGGPQARSRLDARGPRGARALATQPVQRGRQLTLRGAWSRQGLGAAMPGAGGTDGEVWRAFWRAGLGPQRRPGQVRRMAHRKAHPGSGVADRWATAGGRLLALPPSAPDLAPIAASGAKVKPRMRAQAARTLAAWEQAIAAARAAVTRQEAQGWFAHAGYCIASN